jgi:hypothetical protein
VKFVWWSSYKAPSALPNTGGRTTWHEIQPGDTGVVLGLHDDNAVVLFSTVDTLLKIHRTMLESVV